MLCWRNTLGCLKHSVEIGHRSESALPCNVGNGIVRIRKKPACQFYLPAVKIIYEPHAIVFLEEQAEVGLVHAGIG